MGKIHVGRPDGEQLEYEEEEVRGKLERNEFARGTLFWKEGMAEWRPISEFSSYMVYQPGARPIPPQPQQIGGFAQDIRGTTRTVLVLLWLGLALDVLVVFSDYAQMTLLSRDYTLAEGEANDQRQALLGVVQVVLYLITAILFLRWIYRANMNCRALGAPMAITPGWSVGYFFIPFLNLFRPYQAMKEIWVGSHDPSGRTHVLSGLVGLWWALWLLNGVVWQIVMRLGWGAETVADLQSLTGLSMAGGALSILLTVVAIKMLSTIATMQGRAMGAPGQ